MGLWGARQKNAPSSIAAPSAPLVTDAVVRGRTLLLLFAMTGAGRLPIERLRPEVRGAFAAAPPDGTQHRPLAWVPSTSWAALIALSPLIVLTVATFTADPRQAPGWITWVWCAALCAINAVFVLIGPRLWNALITAAIAIDDLGMTTADARSIAAWIDRHYWPRWVQAVLMTLGGATGVLLLAFIDAASGNRFTLGAGEYFTMLVTAALATNGLWILWWIAGLIPALGRRPSLRLHWNNPARTPAIMFLNRALWKVGAAISLGMVLLAIAVQGQPSPLTAGGMVPDGWAAAVAVEFIAFGIVGAIFVRDGIWAQWQVFILVRTHIDRGWAPVQQRLAALTASYSSPGRRDADVLYYAEIDRHFDGLRAVDLKLGWALAWATSIFGAAASFVAAAVTITPG